MDVQEEIQINLIQLVLGVPRAIAKNILDEWTKLKPHEEENGKS